MGIPIGAATREYPLRGALAMQPEPGRASLRAFHRQ